MIYKEGDVVLLESKDLKLCGQITFVDEETICIGSNKLYNTETKILSIKQGKKLKQFAGVEVASNKEAMELLSSVVYKELLKEEIYFFFNNDKNTDHLDPEIMDNSTNELSLNKLESLVNIIIPYGRGEYGFTKIDQIREQAKKNIEEGTVLYSIIIYKS